MMLLTVLGNHVANTLYAVVVPSGRPRMTLGTSSQFIFSCFMGRYDTHGPFTHIRSQTLFIYSNCRNKGKQKIYIMFKRSFNKAESISEYVQNMLRHKHHTISGTVGIKMKKKKKSPFCIKKRFSENVISDNVLNMFCHKHCTVTGTCKIKIKQKHFIMCKKMYLYKCTKYVKCL